MLNKARVWFGQIAPLRLAMYLALVVLVFLLFFWNLSGLTPGLAPSEVSERFASQSIHVIYNSPVNAPHKFLQYILVKLFPNNNASLRLASALMACVFGFCFYKLSASWYGKLIGAFSALIFITMPLFLITAHQATSEVMLFGVVALLWLYVWFLKTPKHKTLAWLILACSTALLLYTPGIIWFLIGAIILCRKPLKKAFSELGSSTKYSGIFIFVVLLAPLIVSGVYHVNVFKTLLLIPSDFAPVATILKNTAWGVSAIFIKAPANQFVMGFLPVINLAAMALIIFGVYAMQAAARPKVIWLGLMVLLGVLASGLSGNVVYLALGLPAITLLVGAGLRYLYIEWRAIFPRNPVPKTFALILIAAVVASQVYYGVRYSLIAWPQSVVTKSVYVLK